MANLCIIPARGGSKRIPRKNILEFSGKPVIAYSIETALESGLFEEVMVSTDDHEIAEIAKRYGAQVPFFRSTRNADDHATTADVLVEVVKQYANSGKSFDMSCCIYATAPLLKAETLKEAYELLIEHNFDSVFPVCQFSFPILRALKREQNGKTGMIWPENMHKRSQDLLPAFHDAGQFYWIRTECLLKTNALYTDNTGSIVLDETEVQDIDTMSDWKLAELKFELLKKQTNDL